MTSMTSRVERTRRDPEEVVANLVQRLACVYYVICMCLFVRIHVCEYMCVSVHVCECTCVCVHTYGKISLRNNLCHIFHKSITLHTLITLYMYQYHC